MEARRQENVSPPEGGGKAGGKGRGTRGGVGQTSISPPPNPQTPNLRKKYTETPEGGRNGNMRVCSQKKKRGQKEGTGAKDGTKDGTNGQASTPPFSKKKINNPSGEKK